MSEHPRYYVKETPCFPASFQVAHKWGGSNETSNFYEKREDAQREADRRNKLWEERNT